MRTARSTRRKARAPTGKPRSTRPPKVFLSHASEDKDRFVIGLATRLRKRGIDVWLDRWEMLPGDSLVRKIFDEGLAHADAVIVVISKYSIAKSWVREELDAAVVRKINDESTLIPVVIDDCPVPECLRATVWENISNLRNYGPSLERIVLAIFGGSEKPPLGAGPAFSSKPTAGLGDLPRVDSLVLQSACEACLDGPYGRWFHVSGEAVAERTRKLGIPDEAVWESFEVLGSRGYVDPGPWIRFAPEASSSRVKFDGFELYLRSLRPDYGLLLKKFASLVVNEDKWQGKDFVRAMRVPELILEHILTVFKNKKWIVVSHYAGGDRGAWAIAEGGTSPELKRWLDSKDQFVS